MQLCNYSKYSKLTTSETFETLQGAI